MMFRGLIVAVVALMGGLALTVTDEPPKPAAQLQADGAGARPVRLASDPAVLRDEPGYQSRPRQQVEPGSSLEVIGAPRDGWVKVRLSNGTQGYIVADRLMAGVMNP